MRKPVLRRFSLRTFADLRDGAGDLLRYLATEHDTLRTRSKDSNRSRWPLHPLWQDLEEQIAQLDCQGVYREMDDEGLLNQRLMRIAISIYGYLKRVAAVRVLQTGCDGLTHREALRQLEPLIEQLHDPLTWRLDVEKRVELMRLGQW